MTSRPIKHRLEPRAARYLQLLVEFGHLEEREMSQVIVTASERWNGAGPVPLRSVQRVAAAMLVTESSPAAGQKDILSADWPLLFF